MTGLPTGTVTFLFSDIEGSTRLLQAQGDAWGGLLARHQELLRAAFAAQQGVEVGTEGDSFFVVFPTAQGATTAAVAAQRALGDEPWPEDAAIRVRMGLHSGEASLSLQTYVGLDVHRAARIAAVGHGGQVLISDATRALVANALADGVALRDLGEHRLRDLTTREHLYQLVIDGLPSDFPALGTLDAIPNNLPSRLTTFLGREREIAQIEELLQRTRLLTLTGPGGTGKTSLSLAVAGRVLPRYPDGVYFVELGTITEADLVSATIAQHLGLPDRGGRTSIERLIDHIGERRLLLVLDNFEQVVDAAPAIAQLLAGARNLTVIVTSRSVLHIYGEQEFPVPPLGLPDPQHLPALDVLSQYEAVALFIERAAAVKPDFAVTNENAPAVAEICVRLDGLPLAIELAAARIRILSPQAMLARIGNRLGLLSSGSRDQPERQQTLRGAIAWSHDMLDEADRSLFACASVFVGGAGLEGVERVCGGEVGGDMLDALSSLVDKSLVRQLDGLDGEPRFSMLETIREFAMGQAIARDRWEDLRCRHGELFLELAEEASGQVMGSAKRHWLDRLEQDHDNLRAAISWAIETDRAEIALRLIAAMWRFWQMRGYLAEGLERAQHALALPHGREHPDQRAAALNGAAGMAYWQANTTLARDLYTEELEQRRALGDRAGAAEALYALSFTHSIAGVLEPDEQVRAMTMVEEALALFRELGDRSGMARCLWALSNIDWGSGRPAEALERAHEALAIFRELDDQWMVGWTSYTIGLAHLQRDHAGGGRPDDRAEAEPWLRSSLRIFAEAGDVSGYTLVLDALAALSVADGDRERAARLSGAVDTLERTSGTGLNLPNRQVVGFDPTVLRDDPSLADAWAEGARMTVAEAVAYALAGTTGPT